MLSPETHAQRIARASIGASDIADMEAFLRSMKTDGAAPKLGGGVEEITAADARRLWFHRGITWKRAQAAFFDGASPVAPQVVKAAADCALSQASADIGTLATRAASGLIEADELYAGMQNAMKRAFMASGSLAHGGASEMTPAAWERVSSQLLERWEGRAQTDAQRGFPGLRAFADEVARGGYDASAGALGADAVGFANGARVVYENEYREAKIDAGFDEVCRVLAGGDVNHCPQCLEIAARGWRPNDGSDPIGGDYCQDFCYCVEIYRRAGQESGPAVQRAIEGAQKKHAVQPAVKEKR